MLLNVLYNLNAFTGVLSIQQIYALIQFTYEWCRKLTSSKSLFPSAAGCDFWGWQLSFGVLNKTPQNTFAHEWS